jgi:hypothetical protein
MNQRDALMKWIAVATAATYCLVLFGLAQRQLSAADQRLHVYMSQQHFDWLMTSHRLVYQP